MLPLTRRAFLRIAALSFSPAMAAQMRAIRVLFIGNSYTYYNGLPTMLANLAASIPGPAVQPTMIAAGGMTLQWHYASGAAIRAIDEQKWDVVVLQEQSALGGGRENGQVRFSPPTIFHESVRKFVARIRAGAARPLLFMTWASRDRPQEQLPLSDAYRTIGRELDVDVAPVGLAWAEARRRWPALELHVADGAHPNATGSYLAACVLYVALTGRSPQGAAPLPDMMPAVAAGLQALAYEMAREPR